LLSLPNQNQSNLVKSSLWEIRRIFTKDLIQALTMPQLVFWVSTEWWWMSPTIIQQTTTKGTIQQTINLRKILHQTQNYKTLINSSKSIPNLTKTTYSLTSNNNIYQADKWHKSSSSTVNQETECNMNSKITLRSLM